MDKRLLELDLALQAHAKTRDFSHAQKVVAAILGLFKLQVGPHDWDKPFTDNGGKLRANAGWFMNAPGYADRRATYILSPKNTTNIDFKAFWLKKTNKSVISWLVALTPNFEDRPYYKKENLGIDFVIPESADKVIVVLSDNFTLRTLELSERLSKTDLEIFSKWIQPLDYSNKEQVHSVLWDSFDFEPVNRIFYKKISELFVDLKQHLVNNQLFDDRHASYFANRLIGRVIFCWFLDKKGIINPKMGYFNTNDQDSTTYYHSKLEPLFFHTLNTPIPLRGGQNIESQPDMFPDNKPKNLFDYTVDLTTPFLNGGLFEPRTNDLAGDPKLTFPADYFDRLYEHLHHYHFTTDESTSDYQQVAIDPEMLGRIFENLLAEQSEDTGEQARKAKGAFYTPREIVDYMCKESLRQYLKSQLPKNSDIDQRIAELLDIKTHEFRDQQRNYQANLKPYKEDLMKALDNLKVLDPACGSGAFPMGMQQLLLIVYERLEARLDPYKTKIGILKNNIYGVDIEPMAVEISRLRAWLSIIVDQDPKVRVEALPNLDFKFVCANSLLPLDSNITPGLGFSDQFEPRLAAIRDQFFAAREHDKKEELKKEFEKIIKEDVIDGFAENTRIKQLKTYIPFNSENVTSFFDPDFMFGFPLFDIVIGNPPYVGEKNHKDIFGQIKNGGMKEFYQGKMDLFYFFFHLGLNLATKDGVVGYITTNYYPTATGAKTLRKDFKTRSTILKLINFNELHIFKSALGQHNMITLLSKGTNDQIKANTCITKRTGEAKSEVLNSIIGGKDELTSYYTVAQNDLYDGNDYQIRLPGTSTIDHDPTQTILAKIKTNNPELSQICNVNMGVQSGADYIGKKLLERALNLGYVDKVYLIKNNIEINTPVYVVDQNFINRLPQPEQSVIKAYIKNSDIKKYHISTKSNLYYLYIDSQVDINSFPTIKDYLKKYRPLLRAREQVNDNERSWYWIRGSKRNFLVNTGEHIVCPYRSKKNIFALTDGNLIGAGDVYYITRKDDGISFRYILAILNSKLCYFWLYNRGKRKGETLELYQQPLSEIPIKIISIDEQKPFIKLVDQILEITKTPHYDPKNPPKEQNDFELQIDKLVYKLYDLKSEEIEHVRSTTK